MTTMNPFDLLGDNDNDDPSILIETVSAQLLKSAVISPKNNQPEKAAKLPTKPLPPAQAVREARNENGRGGGRGFGREGGGRGFRREGGGRGYGREGGGRGYGREGGGRGRGGYNNRDRDYSNNENGFNNSAVSRPQGDEGEKNTERRSYDGPYRGGRQGGYNNEEGRDGDRPRRTYERHSGTGRGNEFKREGAGRGNWGNQYDEVAPTEEVVEETEKTASAEDVSAEDLPVVEEAKDDKEAKPDETEKKEPEEDKEMTLEEYQKVLDEKRKDLLALKPEERKVKVDKDLQSMQPLSNKKTEESIFIKLGSDKEKKKEVSEKEKTKKIVSINEFLKPADGEKYYTPGGRGRGRGRGSRGGGGGGAGYEGGGGGRTSFTPAPKIKDPDHFPTLGGGPRAT